MENAGLSGPIEAIFDSLPDIVFFIKDADGRYLVANQTLVDRCRLPGKAAIAGKRPSDLFGPTLGRRYEEQDARVIARAAPLVGQLELHIYANRLVGWCVTSKYPLIGEDGGATGVVGISRDLKLADGKGQDDGLEAVLDHVSRHLSDPPRIATLASIAGLSLFKLDRRIQRLTGLTTGQWVLKQRLDLASRQLQESSRPIAEVALNAGYADQSAFTRQFQKATGLSPSEFRKLARG